MAEMASGAIAEGSQRSKTETMADRSRGVWKTSVCVLPFIANTSGSNNKKENENAYELIRD